MPAERRHHTQKRDWYLLCGNKHNIWAVVPISNKKWLFAQMPDLASAKQANTWDQLLLLKSYNQHNHENVFCKMKMTEVQGLNPVEHRWTWGTRNKEVISIITKIFLFLKHDCHQSSIKCQMPTCSFFFFS